MASSMVEYLEQCERDADVALQEAFDSILKARNELTKIESELLKAAQRKPHESVGAIYGVSAQAVFTAFSRVEQCETIREHITDGDV